MRTLQPCFQPRFQSRLGAAILALFIAAGATVRLDQPTDAEATAAYRAIPAVAATSEGKQRQIVHITSCRPGKGHPGVVCQAQIKAEPQTRAQALTIQFARGPDSAWVAVVER